MEEQLSPNAELEEALVDIAVYEGLEAFYMNLFLQSDDIKNLDSAVREFEICLESNTNGSIRASLFERLGNIYTARYQESDTIPDLERSIENYQAALDLTPADDSPQRHRRAGCLASSCFHKASRLDNTSAADTCIQLLEDCLAQTETQYLLPLSRHELLAMAYGMRGCRLQDNIDDLNRCIVLYEQLVDLSTGHDHDILRRDSLKSLGRYYLDKFNKTDSLDDLELSLGRSRDALELSAKIDFKGGGRVDGLRNLGSALQARFLRLGDMDDLDLCIQSFEEALDVLPEDVLPWQRYILQENLALACGLRFQAVQSVADLDVSIRITKDSLSLISEDVFQSVANINLGLMYTQRFERTQDLTDLEEAMSRSQNAWDLMPHDDSMAIQASRTIIGSLSSRYEILGDIKDFEKIVLLISKALSLAQGQHQYHKSNLHGLMIQSFISKYRKNERQEDIEKAIEYSKEAMGSLSRDDPGLPGLLFTLGTIYSKKSKKTELKSDYEISIRTMQSALDLTPDDSPDQGYMLLMLGYEYDQQFNRQRRMSDLHASISMYARAFSHSNSAINFRIQAGDNLAKKLVEDEKMTAAYQAATETLSLVSQLTPRSLEVSDKQSLLKTVFWLPSIAAALTLMVNEEPYKAIQYLELGRGVILGTLSDLRINTMHLSTLYPKEEEQFSHLRNQLDTMPNSVTGFTNPRHKISQQLESIICHIRELPGFDRFLLPYSEEKLKSAAINGPVIIINMGYYRSDALIIRSSKITYLNLFDLHYSDAKEHASRSEINRDTLEWLWDTTVEPIFENLGYLDIPNSSWPRVFWIPTGPLSNLPIHAAGYHYTGSNRTAIDRAISMYSSSVRTLIQGRENAIRVASRKLGKAILVGTRALQYAPEEINELGKLCVEMHLEAKIVRPHREEVLASLSECDIFHFAGHGRVHASDPSQSALQMDDKPVTIQDLYNIKLHHRAPFLAYLSACNTGHVGDEELVDEGLHLIGVCQLAGFRNVIGTLRPVEDKICVEVAKRTWEWVGDNDLSDSSVSEGLHSAIRSLRDRWVVDADGDTLQNDTKGEEWKKSQSNAVSDGHENIKNRRDLLNCEEEPMYWAPFVCFGIE